MYFFIIYYSYFRYFVLGSFGWFLWFFIAYLVCTFHVKYITWAASKQVHPFKHVLFPIKSDIHYHIRIFLRLLLAFKVHWLATRWRAWCSQPIYKVRNALEYVPVFKRPFRSMIGPNLKFKFALLLFKFIYFFDLQFRELLFYFYSDTIYIGIYFCIP